MSRRKEVRDQGTQTRLGEALAVYQKARAIRVRPLRRRLDEIAFYPAHDKRQETAAYKAVHEHLVHTLDLPCLVCGVRESTLKKARENPYGATAMETHHHVIEWALAEAVDPAKFNRTVLPHLRARHPEDHGCPENRGAVRGENMRNRRGARGARNRDHGCPK